jgi:Domain of unknown function (DUF1929)
MNVFTHGFLQSGSRPRPQVPSMAGRTWVGAVMAMSAGLFAPGAHAAMDTYLKGSFGPVVNWPLIPLHVVLLPDGRVLSYGTDGAGNQTGQFTYDVWNPTLGTGASSHLTLPNTTATDIFCTGQIVLPGSGTVLLTGGDKTIDGVRNYSVNDVTFFDFTNSTMRSAPQTMSFLRWYPTSVVTAAGEILILGGRADPNTPAPTPEVYTEGKGWRLLSNATSDEAYGLYNWNYPRAWQAPNGKVFIMTVWGGTYYLDPAGAGNLQATPTVLPPSDAYLPSLMYAPGKILTLRTGNVAGIVDITGATPQVTPITGVGQDRFHGSTTVMADGRVFVNGGSSVTNEAQGVAYTARIWNPTTKAWTTAATAKQMRLYHSASLLLPDGRIFTGGGGAPGPQNNLNAEIYTPPYLYQQNIFGNLATRPKITSAPTTSTWGAKISVTMDTTSISKMTLVKTGSATHTVDFDQRFMQLSYTGTGKTRTVTMPASRNLAPPGYYMLFVFNGSGVPSVAKIIKLI